MLNIVNKKLEILTIVSFLGISLVLCLSGWWSFQTNQEYIQAQHRLVKITEQLRVLNLTLSTFQDAETGQRGYLLTKNPAYLEPYARAAGVANTNLAWLRSVLSDEPRFDSHLAAINSLKDQKLDELARTIRLSNESGRASALELVNTDFGKIPWTAYGYC
jgi:CHASE3 domain sensor protein